MIIIQIVPKLLPAINGVGDYALNLARQLQKDFGIQTHFVIGDSTWSGETRLEGFPISQVRKHNGSALLSLLPSDRAATVLLHYVGYGYAARGTPSWLIEGLERWKISTTNARLVTMFHEIYAAGQPPWTSAFWLLPVQKKLAARLVILSDRCFTSKQDYAQLMDKLSPGKQREILTLPVFSNVEEPKQVSPLTRRTRRLVVFGHRNSRTQVYQKCLPALEQICKALKIEEICDIGVPTGLEVSQINGIPVVKKGVIEATKISEILLDSVIGLLNFPPPAYLAKSTIFAAYCAHGLIPSMTSSSLVPIDGLQAGKHYWAADAQKEPLCLEVGQAIADNAYAWYQTHSLSAQAKIFAAHLKD